MQADFEVAFGAGRAGARLELSRAAERRAHRTWWLLLAAAVLTLPFAVMLAVNALTYALSGSPAHLLPASRVGSGGPQWGRNLALGPPLAVLMYAAARLRLHVSRADHRVVARLTAQLSSWEVAVALLALVVAGVFYGHLLADGWACANGVRSAC